MIALFLFPHPMSSLAHGKPSLTTVAPEDNTLMISVKRQGTIMQCPRKSELARFLKKVNNLTTRKNAGSFLGLFIVTLAIIGVAIKPEYLLELLFGIVPTAIKWIKGK